MSSKLYFVIPCVALAGFAVWFVDFEQDYRLSQQRAAAAAEERRQEQEEAQAIAEAKRRSDMLEAAATKRAEREARKAREQAAIAACEAAGFELAALHDEIAALKQQRERLTGDRAEVSTRIETILGEQAALTLETEFLSGYLYQARANVARAQGIVEHIKAIPSGVETTSGRDESKPPRGS